MMITITLVYTATGQSESLPIDSTTTTISDLIEWSKALFGIDGDSSSAGATIQLFKDGRALSNSSNDANENTMKLAQLNIVHGDLIAVQKQQQQQPQRTQQQQQQHHSTSSTNSGGGFGGLDFSNLLTPNSQPPSMSTAAPSSASPAPVYYPGMNLDDAMMNNPHPLSFVTLLLQKDHLIKELNYHNPRLATKFYNPNNGQKISIEQAAIIWRDEMVKGGIQSAMKASERFHKENTMKKRLESNANDVEASEYFQKKDSQALIDQQYHQMMEEYPEALGRVLMLYIDVKINGHTIQAFCDSGAQATIISKRIAQQCHIDHLIDTRFAGIAVGVGTGTILGRIHMVQLQINDSFFPCSVTVMDDPPKSNNSDEDPSSTSGKEMPFLFGLDMMKRHLCHIDLERGVLKFRLGTNEYMEAKFLHEKDLAEAQGGTKGFDPNVANQELLQRQKAMDDDYESKNNAKHQNK